MQVNSVSLSQNATGMAFKATPEEHLFASLKDRDLKQIAWEKASKDVNDKKHRKLDNLLFYSLPIAGGISASTNAFAPKVVKKIGAHNLRALKLARFGSVAAGWAAGLAALDLLWNTKDYLAGKVNVIRNHPAISAITTFIAGFGVLSLVNNASFKGLKNIVNSKQVEKMVPTLRKMSKALNESKVLNKTSEFLSKFPSPIKDMAKGAARFAPLIVIGVQIAHLFNHQRVKAQVTVRNFEELKKAQQLIKEDIADEKIEKRTNKKTIADLHAEYEQMLKTKPIIDAQTKKPVTFEEFVKLATTIVK